MTISFHGAAGCVTGSKHLLTLANGKSILLDCGLFQGMGKETFNLNSQWGFEPSQVSLLILSHAHIDHSGLIPKLVKDGFKGIIYCTPATKDLATILMEDSAKIQQEDARFANKRRQALNLPLLANPLYDVEHAKKAITQFNTIEYNIWQKIDDDITLKFTDAGHILGSACVHLNVTENSTTKQITFSGDVGRYRNIILKQPETFSQANIIIMESTYGDGLHAEAYDAPNALLNFIEDTCIVKQGKLIIPAFSVGRTQEILYAINNLKLQGKIKNIPVYVDSPMSEKATEVLKKYPNYFNDVLKKVYQSDDDPFNFEGLQFIESSQDSKLLNYNPTPCVIISSSGMADAGRVKHHINNSIENSKNTILLAGYCEPKSLGGQLAAGKKEVRIFGQMKQVNATVGKLKSMSAHGDKNDLVTWLHCQNANLIEKIFLVHGEPDVQLKFIDTLNNAGHKYIIIPQLHQSFEV